MSPEQAFLEDAINEQITQSAQWVEHYKADPDGVKDHAFWDGKNRAYTECLNLVQSIFQE